MGRTRRFAAVGAGLATLLVPALVAAHPLGNFTINHYAEVRVEPERVLLETVWSRSASWGASSRRRARC